MSVPYPEPHWDAVVSTASSARQAELYRSEIQRRALSGALPVGTEFLVVPDPGDRWVGSGGATINAILERARPWFYGAKLAGAGGGGFLMLLARDREAAKQLRGELAQTAMAGGAVVDFRIASDSLRVMSEGGISARVGQVVLPEESTFVAI